MHFIKYHPLKERLRERSVTDKDALPYLLIFAALTATIGSLPMIGEFNKWDGIQAALAIIVAIGGTLYIYGENGGADGYDLNHKYVILGWVVFVRWFLVFIPAGILLYIIGEILGLTSESEITGPFDVLIIFIAEVIYYQRLGRHIRDTYMKTN